ncbi:MAG: NAD(P)/FAD-dependent oxidoreductase, partial [Planctomycetota bacterium]
GRLPVKPSCQVANCEHLFAIGDVANCPDAAGKPLPGIAPVAMQQGAYVANLLAAAAGGKADRAAWSNALQKVEQPFVYRDRGTMATIGRAKAVAQIGKRQFCGFFAWLLWLFVHLMLIVQFQNRLLILMQWAWNYVTFNRSNRIITGEQPVVIVEANEEANV